MNRAEYIVLFLNVLVVFSPSNLYSWNEMVCQGQSIGLPATVIAVIEFEFRLDILLYTLVNILLLHD